MRVALNAGVVFLSLCGFEVVPVEAGQAAPPSRPPRHLVDLTIVVRDANAEAHPYEVTSFRSVRPGSPELASQFKGLTIQELEGMSYHVVLKPLRKTVTSTGRDGARCFDAPIETDFSISGAGSTLVVLLPRLTCRAGTNAFFDLESRVQWKLTKRPPANTWVRVQPLLYSGEPRDAFVDGDGRFSLNPAGPGLHVVTLFRDAEVLGHATVKVEGKHFEPPAVVAVPWP